jgi:BolA family transcriptional regulator, general stress-responsive regulator
MSRDAFLRTKLTEALSPSHLEVVNESHMHKMQPGAESHFRVVVVSALFEGKPLLARHRLVNAAVDEALKNGLHALAATLKTPSEWQASPIAAASPPCASKVKP